MKKVLLALCFAYVFLAASHALPALAAETDSNAGGPSNVTITVVMPEAKAVADENPILPGPALVKLYPSDVLDIRDGNGWQIIKTYELSASDKPEDIPCESFERSGWRFTLTDITRQETAITETREHSETVTLNTDTKELEKILPMLQPSMEYKSGDGFTGMVTLDVSSIKVETAGTKTSSYKMSITREYPHLSINDTSLVPKTVVDRGTSYSLAGVDWQAGNYVTVDYEALPEYYTAIATYTTTGVSTKAAGYIITAVYTGTLAKISQGKAIYSALFWGEEICAMPETVETSIPMGPTQILPGGNGPSKNAGLPGTGALLAIIPIMAIIIGSAYYFMKRKVKHNA